MHYSKGAFWRPLFEQDIEMLQVATGCSHNACRFCDMYHCCFSASPMDEIEQDIEELSTSYRVPPRLFLTGGNAFHLDADVLLEIASLVSEKLPAVSSIGCFARVDDVAAKTDAELEALAGAGFDMISIGAESGLDEALSRMGKGHTAADIVEQSERLDRAGIEYAFFYLAGIAGAGRGIENARVSAEVFSKVSPRIIMIHTMTMFPGTPLFSDVESGVFKLAKEVEVLEEMREFYAVYPKHVRMLAMHYANTATFDGYVPEHRDRILELMDSRIAQADESQLHRFRRSIRSI